MVVFVSVYLAVCQPVEVFFFCLTSNSQNHVMTKLMLSIVFSFKTFKMSFILFNCFDDRQTVVSIYALFLNVSGQ